MEDFESKDDAEGRKATLARRLANGDKPARAIAKILLGCARGNRCESASCPVCARKFRSRFAAAVAQVVAADSSVWTAVSAVPLNRYALGQLNQFAPKQMKGRLRKQFERSDLADIPAFGGIDFNWVINLEGQSYWNAHWYLLVKAEALLVRDALERYFPADQLTARPLVCKELDTKEVLRAATYMLKNRFEMRQSTLDARGNADTKKCEIGDAQLFELMPLLHKWSSVARIFQRNVA